MKTIRRGVFETNSSSTHSITICSMTEYKEWQDGNVLLGEDGKFYTKEQAIEDLKSCKWYSGSNFDDSIEVEELLDDNFKTYDKYGYDHEQFEEFYKTKSGDEVVAFGYYGWDG